MPSINSGNGWFSGLSKWMLGGGSAESEKKVDVPSPTENKAPQTKINPNLVENLMAKEVKEQDKGWSGTLKNVGAKIASPFIKGSKAAAKAATDPLIDSLQAWTAGGKQERITKAETMMYEELGWEFVELYRLVKEIGVTQTAETLGSMLPFSKKMPGLAADLAEVNLAIGFSNLAKEMKKNKASLPHFDQQPMILNLLLYLFKQGGETLELQKLLENYMTQEDRAEAESHFEKLAEKFFGTAYQSAELKEQIHQLTKSSTTELTPEKLKVVLADFLLREPAHSFSHLKAEDELFRSQMKLFQDQQAMVGEFTNGLVSIAKVRAASAEDLLNKDLLAKLTTLLVTQLFPNKLEDIYLPLGIEKISSLDFSGYYSVGESLYKAIEGSVSDKLFALVEKSPEKVADLLKTIVEGDKYLSSLLDVKGQRERLIHASKDGLFLADVAKALSRDIPKVIPAYLTNSDEIAQEVTALFGFNDFNSEQPKELTFAQRAALIMLIDKGDFGVESAQAWAKETGLSDSPLSEEQQKALAALVKKSQSALVTEQGLARKATGFIAPSFKRGEGFETLRANLLAILEVSRVEDELNAELLKFLESPFLTEQKLFAWIERSGLYPSNRPLTLSQVAALNDLIRKSVLISYRHLETNTERNLLQTKAHALFAGLELTNSQTESLYLLLNDPSLSVNHFYEWAASQSIKMPAGKEALLQEIVKASLGTLVSENSDLLALETLLKLIGVKNVEVIGRAELINLLRREDLKAEDITQGWAVRQPGVGALKLSKKDERALSEFLKGRKLLLERQKADIEVEQALVDLFNVKESATVAQRAALILLLDNQTVTAEDVFEWFNVHFPGSIKLEVNFFQTERAILEDIVEKRVTYLKGQKGGIKEGIVWEASPKTANLFQSFFGNLIKRQILDVSGQQGLGNEQKAEEAKLIGLLSEGVMLQLFTVIAEKNPAIEGKDTVRLLAEKTMNLVAVAYKEFKQSRNNNAARAENSLKELSESVSMELFTEILGLGSVEKVKATNKKGVEETKYIVHLVKELDWLPAGIKSSLFEQLQETIEDQVKTIDLHLSALSQHAATSEAAKEGLKAFGYSEKTNKAYAECMVDGLIDVAIGSVLEGFQEVAAEKGSSASEKQAANRRGVNLIRRLGASPIESLLRKHLNLKEVIDSYSGHDSLNDLIGESLIKLSGDETIDDRQLIQETAKTVLMSPLNNLISSVVDFEKNHPSFNEKLAECVLSSFVDNMKFRNQAKKAAASHGRAVLGRDYARAAGPAFHGAVQTGNLYFNGMIETIENKLKVTLNEPQKRTLRTHFREMLKREGAGGEPVNQQEILDLVVGVVSAVPLIGNANQSVDFSPILFLEDNELSLVDFLRKEGSAISEARSKGGFDNASKRAMMLLFPEGANSLPFIDESMRESTWKMLESNLFPMIFGNAVDTILNPDLIKGILSNILSTTLEGLNAEVVPAGPSLQAPSVPLDALDRLAGDLIPELVDVLVLPESLKKMLFIPGTREVPDSIKQALGSAIRGSFHETFVADTIKTALSSMVDPEGRSIFSYTPSEKLTKDVATITGREKTEAELKQLTRNIVRAGISKSIRTWWVNLQHNMDKSIEETLGGVALWTKEVLDVVCRFVFFTIIGSLLSVLLWPVKKLVEFIIFQSISLDQNRQAIIDYFTEVPIDETGSHASWHEDLLYTMIERIGAGVDETVRKDLEAPEILGERLAAQEEGVE